MIRIFLSLSIVSTLFLGAAFVLGLQIDDPKVAERAVQEGVGYHFLAALAGLLFASLVHAIVLTYFMGTGRWLEETSAAYRLPNDYYLRAKSLKYRVIPLMMGVFLLLLATGALGAAADPGSPVQFKGWLGVPAATWHLGLASLAVALNVVVNWIEFQAIEANGQVVDQVLAEVRRIRTEKGLAV